MGWPLELAGGGRAAHNSPVSARSEEDEPDGVHACYRCDRTPALTLSSSCTSGGMVAVSRLHDAYRSRSLTFAAWDDFARRIIIRVSRASQGPGLAAGSIARGEGHELRDPNRNCMIENGPLLRYFRRITRMLAGCRMDRGDGDAFWWWGVRAGWALVSARRAGISVVWVVIALLGLCGVVAVGVATATAIPRVGAAGVSPAQGVFSGFTSQSGNGDEIRFRVSGSSLRNETLSWQARCRSGRTLLSGTLEPELPLTGGGWRDSAGRYVARLLRGSYPVRGGVIGHFRVSENSGRFMSVISAAGVERVTATLYKHGRRIDSCSTGPVSWTAGNASATGSASPLIVAPDATIGGLTYAQWETKAWQWSIANLHSHYARAPRTSACVTAGQQGPVWFPEVDYYDLDFAHLGTVTCHVPSGQYVFLLGASVECSTVERPPFHASSDAGLLRCSHVTSASSVLFDGQLLSPSGFPVSTGVFSFTMPASNNYLQVPGKTHGRGAAFGLPIMLGPLAPGIHTIINARHYRGPALVGTLRLIVS